MVFKIIRHYVTSSRILRYLKALLVDTTRIWSTPQLYGVQSSSLDENCKSALSSSLTPNRPTKSGTRFFGNIFLRGSLDHSISTSVSETLHWWLLELVGFPWSGGLGRWGLLELVGFTWSDDLGRRLQFPLGTHLKLAKNVNKFSTNFNS